jgi:hypothetical protein
MNLVLVLAVVATIMATLAFAAAMVCIAYVVGLRNSTHQISYVPLGGKAKDTENQADAEKEVEDLIDEPEVY